MLSKTLASTQDGQEILQHIHAAEQEYKLAKQELDGFLQALRTCADGMAGMEDGELVTELVEREEKALSGVADALQALYDHNERRLKNARQSTLCGDSIGMLRYVSASARLLTNLSGGVG